MREGLCHDIALRAFSGGRKVAMIDDADDLNEEGANALLKTLEEPPPGSVLILVGTTADKQLPTIRSRSQIIRFRGLDPETIAELLLAQGVVENPAEAERLAALAEGSLSRAVELADEELWAFRDQFLAQLARVDQSSVALAREVNEFVDSAGKDAPSRRRRLRQIIGWRSIFIASSCGPPPRQATRPRSVSGWRRWSNVRWKGWARSTATRIKRR